MIVGFAGYARSGKHEAARALEPDFKVVAFADKLREFLYMLNPIVRSDDGFFLPRLRTVIDEYGWDGYKESGFNDEIRRLIQVLGTDCGRGLISDTVWIDALFKDDHPNLAVADVRFPNEAQAIRDRGGVILWIDRPGVGPLNDHASENSLTLKDCSYFVYNGGDLNDLHGQVCRAVRYFSS